MRNKIIDLFFKSNKRKYMSKDQNNIYLLLHIHFNHDNKDPIVELEESLFNIQRITGEKFHITFFLNYSRKIFSTMSGRDKIRKTYLKRISYQMLFQNYHFSKESSVLKYFIILVTD